MAAPVTGADGRRGRRFRSGRLLLRWALHRLSGHRLLWTPANNRGWGALRLTTTGHRSGQPRTVIIGYLEDGPDLVAHHHAVNLVPSFLDVTVYRRTA